MIVNTNERQEINIKLDKKLLEQVKKFNYLEVTIEEIRKKH